MEEDISHRRWNPRGSGLTKMRLEKDLVRTHWEWRKDDLSHLRWNPRGGELMKMLLKQDLVETHWVVWWIQKFKPLLLGRGGWDDGIGIKDNWENPPILNKVAILEGQNNYKPSTSKIKSSDVSLMILAQPVLRKDSLIELEGVKIDWLQGEGEPYSCT
jgi:hypothetical protein